MLVHQWVWEHHNGPIPKGKVVMHICDNPPCYRYEHLRLGTQAENLDDMRAKGRAVNPPISRHYGEANGMSHLTVEQVADIRGALAAGGVVQRRLAEQYDVSPSTITRIKKGEVW
jgi:HNH endonuclease